ncbi:GDSL esterase/lipase At5g45910 [Linum perenne]
MAAFHHQPSLSNGILLILLLLITNSSCSSLLLKGCDFNAIYNFGDSISDTGNLVIETPDVPFAHFPYGMTIHRATGRFSDGYLLIDHIAEAAGLPYVNPSLNETLDHSKGANFAVGGVSLLSNETRVKLNVTLPHSQSSVDIQLQWFEQHLKKRFQNETARREHLKGSLFMINGGSNDYGSVHSSRPVVEAKIAIMPDVFAAMTDYIMKLINEYGATKLVVTGIYQGGCLVNYKFNDNKTHCDPTTNSFHSLHNGLLELELQLLRKMFPNVRIAYADIWGATQWLLDHYWSLGYRYPNYMGCCGSASMYCGTKGAPYCRNPNEYMFWDDVHFTDYTYRLISKMIIPQLSSKLGC